MTSQWFGDYEIVKQLRVGGMATLHLARRHGAAGFSRLVALKMIHPHLVAQPSFVEMFVDEARICSHITHPNVVHVEEFGVLDGVHYLVMEYIDGCSANELLQVFRRERRVLDPELAARVIMQIAGGLHAAHETDDPDGQPLELIHRDISPSNVLISADGNAKLIDFGIAKARNRVSETQAGVTLKGKYRYVAPEQALHAVVDRRCDIFSLGIVFWELLVGQALFAEDSHLGLLNRLRHTEAPAPSAVNPAVPAVFDPIVLAMLEHDPADRPQTAAEVQRRIASAIPGANNREAAELGAFAVEVRDKCAERRARRATASSTGPDSQSFSPSPSPRPRATSEYRIEVESTRRSAVQDATPPPVPPPWWRRRGVQLGAGLVGASLLGGAVIAGILVGRQGRGADASASSGPRPSRELELVVPHDPAGPARTTAPIAPIAPVTRVAPPAPAPPPPARPPPPIAVVPPTPAPVEAPAAVQAPAAPAPVRHDVARAVAKPRPLRPARPAADPDAPRSAPPPHAPRVPGVWPPYTTEPFDEAASPGAAPAAPEAAKTRKPPNVPDFDN